MTLHGGDLVFSKGGYATNTEASVPTNKLIAQVSASPSPPAQAPRPSPGPTTQSSSNLEPLSYFRYHREDRLMGVLAGGLAPLTTTTTRRRTLSKSTGPATSSKDKASASRSLSNVPLTTRSMRDILVFGIGAWTEEENINIR